MAQGLQRLPLIGSGSLKVPLDEMVTLASSLHALEFLYLADCPIFIRLVAHLHLAPALCVLKLGPPHEGDTGCDVIHLLCTAPKLRCEIAPEFNFTVDARCRVEELRKDPRVTREIFERLRVGTIEDPPK